MSLDFENYERGTKEVGSKKKKELSFIKLSFPSNFLAGKKPLLTSVTFSVVLIVLSTFGGLLIRKDHVAKTTKQVATAEKTEDRAKNPDPAIPNSQSTQPEPPPPATDSQTVTNPTPDSEGYTKSDKSKEQVAQEYKSDLESKGWTISSVEKTDPFIFITGSKNNLQISVVIAPDENGKTTILVTENTVE